MTLDELTQFLAALPAAERARLIEMGRQYSSTDTLEQADKTLNALAIEGYAALLADHGFSLEDGARLKAMRDALEQAGGRRASAQTSRKATNDAYDAGLSEGKKARKKATSILEGTLADLRKKPGQEAKDAVDAITSILQRTKSVGADARSLATQLELLLEVLKSNATVAQAAAAKGGVKVVLDLESKARTLRAVSPSVLVPRGTPAETERMDLLDGLIIELTRNARKAARSAADDVGQASVATAFELDKLYRVNNQSKADAQARAKRKEKIELILKTLAARSVPVSKEAEETIRASKDDAALDRWLSLAGSVAAAEALFATS